MNGLVVGIDLCDDYTQMNCTDEDKTWTIPTVICKHKHTDAWFVGEEAYAHTLRGEGSLVDKLVKLVLKEGAATLGQSRYEAKELLKLFLERVLALAKESYGTEEILQLVFSVRNLNVRLTQALYECAVSLGIPRKNIHIISHSEGFIYYILSQKKEIWNGTVGMFDLSAQKLSYYEMKVQRGMKKTTVVAEYENMDEGFDLDILRTASGARLADKILCSCAERMMQRKAYSSVFLMGKGFDERDWAENFMKLLCTRRKVYMEPAIFAKGAAYRALDSMEEKTSYPFTMICEGRLKSTVSMNVLHKGKETSVVLAAAGENWYDRVSTVDVIPDRQNSIDLVVTSLDARKKKSISIPLDGFPQRPERTTKVQVCVSFLDEWTMDIRLCDRGFGELFPASGIQIRQEVML